MGDILDMSALPQIVKMLFPIVKISFHTAITMRWAILLTNLNNPTSTTSPHYVSCAWRGWGMVTLGSAPSMHHLVKLAVQGKGRKLHSSWLLLD